MTKQIIQSFAWHGDQCFFVATVERKPDKTAGILGGNETTVWAYDYDERERGKMLYFHGAPAGSVGVHTSICEELIEAGFQEFVASEKGCES